MGPTWSRKFLKVQKNYKGKSRGRSYIYFSTYLIILFIYYQLPAVYRRPPYRLPGYVRSTYFATYFTAPTLPPTRLRTVYLFYRLPYRPDLTTVVLPLPGASQPYFRPSTQYPVPVLYYT